MNFVCKYFDELTVKELYELLKARSAIFVVEQNCPYLDMDDKDYYSLHMFYEEDGRVLACCRAFIVEEGVVKIGRVLSIEHGKGWGGKILKSAIARVKEIYNPQKIVIAAQCYAKGYYEREGFKQCSGEFLEDGIPHIMMELIA
ncbi:MAG: GNAT family N-acetyltransferase [Candidatus Coproplasma sp.]